MNSIQSFFAPKKWLLWLSLALIFGLGLTIRLYDLTDLPLDFHPTRQLHSVLMARGMYYQNLPGIPDWQREMAVQQWKAEGLIEPPFMEWITAQTYRLVGEQLWVARVYSIIFWLLGGIPLFLLARTLSSGTDGGLIGLAYFLILPYGAIASRAFQPDPLMTTLIIFCFWAAVRWHQTSSWKWAIAAGLLGGLAILVKAVAVFFVGGGLIGLVLAGKGLRRALREPQVWVATALAVIPYGIFHIYGVYISGLLESQFSLRFFPQMWKDPVFYLRWNGQISSVVGFEWFLLGLLGTFLIKDKAQRAMMVGAWVGYFVYGMTLPYHISTHDYYQVPFIPLVALGLAAGAELLLRNLRGARWVLYPLVIGVVLFAVTIKAWDVRVTLKRDDYRGEAAMWQKLGQELGPGASVVGLTHDYGYRLSYWGWVTPSNWLTSGDFNYRALAGQTFDMDQLFAEQTAGKDYFVVTLFNELESQPELKSLLYNHYPILDETGDYIIFDLRHPTKPLGS